MAWHGPILTDSGGFQVFSLLDTAKIDADGVTFRSVYDGAPARFTPELAMEIQRTLGSDIAMCFDECPPGGAERHGRGRRRRPHAALGGALPRHRAGARAAAVRDRARAASTSACAATAPTR